MLHYALHLDVPSHHLSGYNHIHHLTLAATCHIGCEAHRVQWFNAFDVQAQAENDAEYGERERRGGCRTPAYDPRRALVRMRPAVRTMKLSHAALQVRNCMPGSGLGLSRDASVTSGRPAEQVPMC